MKISILKNWHLKLLSFIIAFGLWFYIANQKNDKQDYKVKLQYKNIPFNLYLSKNNPESVVLSVLGPKNLVNNQNTDYFIIPVDLSNFKAGSNRTKILSSSISLPNGLKVSSISPSEITINLLKKYTKKVKITARLINEPKKNYYVEKIEIEPSEVTLEGSKEELENLKTINTEKIDIKNLFYSIKRNVKLDVNDLNVNIKDLNKIKINISIKEKQIIKLFKNVQLKIRGIFSKEDFEISPKQVTLTLKGTISEIKKLDTEKLRGYLDVKKKEETVVPIFDLPNNIKIISLEPLYVKVKKKE